MANRETTAGSAEKET